jgi:hypothetical protein
MSIKVQKKIKSKAPVVEICVPTLNRPELLKRLAHSIPKGVKFSVSQQTEPQPLTKLVNELYSESVGDIVIMLSDHIELQDGCIEAVLKAFSDNFPDLDGVVGLNMVDLPEEGRNKYASNAMGRKFLDRYPEKNPSCPQYHHFFADTEIGMLAESLDKFYFAEDAHILCHHPAHGDGEKDETYRASRANYQVDVKTWERRQHDGLLWGVNVANDQ